MLFSESDNLFRKLKSYFPSLIRKESEVRSAVAKLLKINPDAFSKNLKQIRESRGISQISLANYLGTSQTSYSSWETGVHVPRLQKLERLCEHLSVDIGDFFSEAITTIGNEIPIFNTDDFKAIPSDHFFNYVLKHTQTKTKDYFNNEFEFVFYNSDDAMISNERSIPKNSLVFCSITDLKNSDKSKIIQLIDGKIVVLSIAKGPATLRQIKYDGTYIRLKAWNKEIDEKICLLSEKQVPPQGKEKAATYLNCPLVLSMVEFFGVAKKIVMDVGN
jgi:transcriptional regulator with XRE-family HTH domain